MKHPLYVTGRHRKPDLEAALEAAGVSVTVTEIYDAVPPDRLSEEALAALQSGNIDGVTFFSTRTADLFMMLTREAGLSPELLKKIAAYCVGDAGLSGSFGTVRNFTTPAGLYAFLRLSFIKDRL
jgi:uroporphyrinogen-III synthase